MLKILKRTPKKLAKRIKILLSRHITQHQGIDSSLSSPIQDSEHAEESESFLISHIKYFKNTISAIYQRFSKISPLKELPKLEFTSKIQETMTDVIHNVPEQFSYIRQRILSGSESSRRGSVDESERRESVSSTHASTVGVLEESDKVK